MEYISSDTNVWIDFSTIDRISLPFLLPYTYIMNKDAINDELLSPAGLREKLIQCGLVSVDLTIEEFDLAGVFGSRYHKLSTYDRIALAIAKERNIILLTGDGALREAAKCENVNFFGTIGVFDQLLNDNHIDDHEYVSCLQKMLEHNGIEIRLPKNEINTRLQRFK